MFTLSFRTDNAAFAGDTSSEVARILRAIAGRIEGGDAFEGQARDANGNTVGDWSLDEPEDEPE